MGQRKSRKVAAVVVSLLLGCAAESTSETSSAASALAGAPAFERIDIAEITGTAFVVAGNVVGNPWPEIVASGFGTFGFGPFGPIIPAAGTVTLFQNAQPGNAPNGQLANWDPTTIVAESDGITIPNRPTLADVDGDGDVDVIVPGGYFFDSFGGQARGSLTWWESRGNGKRWIRHDLVTGSAFSYHSALFADFDGDGLAALLAWFALRASGLGSGREPIRIAGEIATSRRSLELRG